jgi:hypothetical protein
MRNRMRLLHFLCMEPDRFGRKLGIGVRVAGSILRDRAAQAAHSTKQEARAMPRQASAYVDQGVSRVDQGASRGRAVSAGARKFGESVWGPFVHAGGVLWLEITGLFFALFGLFFAQGAYRLRHAWHSGPDRSRFLIYAVVTLVFFYFAFSSFYRARRKEKKRRAQQ